MFKEKYLIFREGEPTPEYAPKKPDSRAALSEEAGKLAENLTKPTAEQILLSIFGANFEDAQITLAANYLPLIEALSEDSQQLEYKGLKHNGKDFIVSWRKGGKDLDKTFSSYLPNMEPADFDKLALLFSATDKDRAIERQVNEFCTKQIGSFLAKNGHDIPYKTFMVSYLVRVELIPILTSAYKHGTPYEFIPGEDGFTLKNQNKDFPEQQFDLADYDENLNLKNPEDENATVPRNSGEKDSQVTITEKMTEEDRQSTLATMESQFKVIANSFDKTEDDKLSEKIEAIREKIHESNADQEEIKSYQQDFFPEEYESLRELTQQLQEQGDDPQVREEIIHQLEQMPKAIVEKCPALSQIDKDIQDAFGQLDQGVPMDDLKDQKEKIRSDFDQLRARARETSDHKTIAALALYKNAIEGVAELKYERKAE